MNQLERTALKMICATALVLGLTQLAAAAGPAARCAASLERLDTRLDQCAVRCMDGARSKLEACAARCQDTFGAQRERALARSGCETLTQLVAMPIGAQALLASGGIGGSALWCACKLDCDNTYSGMPVLIKACKAQCDKDNKCRKGTTGIRTIGTFIR